MILVEVDTCERVREWALGMVMEGFDLGYGDLRGNYRWGENGD